MAPVRGRNGDSEKRRTGKGQSQKQPYSPADRPQDPQYYTEPSSVYGSAQSSSAYGTAQQLPAHGSILPPPPIQPHPYYPPSRSPQGQHLGELGLQPSRAQAHQQYQSQFQGYPGQSEQHGPQVGFIPIKRRRSSDHNAQEVMGLQIPPLEYPLPERPGNYNQNFEQQVKLEQPVHPETYQYHAHGLPSHLEQQYQMSDRPRRSTPAYENKAGLPGYPPPSDPCTERERFSPEDDAKLKQLKEECKLSWRQIQDFFPGRKSGTLQVRYCTKLKDKRNVNWNRDLVCDAFSSHLITAPKADYSSQDARLRRTLNDDWNNRWSRIAQKLGNNMTAQACAERWGDIEGTDPEPEAYD